MGLLVGLPMSVALYKQQTVIKREELEPHFHEIKNEKGEVINEFYFNRGLWF